MGQFVWLGAGAAAIVALLVVLAVLWTDPDGTGRVPGRRRWRGYGPPPGDSGPPGGHGPSGDVR